MDTSQLKKHLYTAVTTTGAAAVGFGFGSVAGIAGAAFMGWSWLSGGIVGSAGATIGGYWTGKKIGQLETKINSYRKQIDRIIKEEDSLIIENENLVNTIQTLNTERENYVQRIESDADKINKLIEKNKNYIEKCISLKKIIETYEDEKENNKKLTDKLMTSLDEEEDFISNVTKDIVSIKNILDNDILFLNKMSKVLNNIDVRDFDGIFYASKWRDFENLVKKEFGDRGLIDVICEFKNTKESIGQCITRMDRYKKIEDINAQKTNDTSAISFKNKNNTLHSWHSSHHCSQGSPGSTSSAIRFNR